MVEQGQVSESNEETMWKKRTAGVWELMELMKYIIHACHVKTNQPCLQDSVHCTTCIKCTNSMLLALGGCTNPEQKLWSYVLKRAGVADKHSASGHELGGSWADMCHCQVSTWSTLHHQISKCFICVSISHYVWSAETWNSSFKPFVTTLNNC